MRQGDLYARQPVSAPGLPESTPKAAMRQQLFDNAAEISQAYTVHVAAPQPGPLTGYRIAVTSANRAEEFCALLRRNGAEVASAAAINMIAPPDDNELRSNTEALITQPPDILLAHNGIGLRGWLAAADEWGLANQLIAVLSTVRIVARGPKVTGALRACGLHEEWSPDSESSRAVLRYLVQSGLSGMRVAVQLHGVGQHPSVASSTN